MVKLTIVHCSPTLRSSSIGAEASAAAAVFTAAICEPAGRAATVSLRPITTKCTSEIVSPGWIVIVRT